MSACISGWCMEHGRRVSIPDIYDDERIPQDAYRPTFVKSLAMVPVRQEEPIAALGAYWAHPHNATDPELDLLQTIANAAALSISYVQLRETRSRRKWGRVAQGLASLPQRRAGRLKVWNPSPSFAWSGRFRQTVIALALSATAAGLRLALEPLVGDEAPYAFFYAAVVLSVAYAGWFGGVIALIAGGLIGNVLFVEPLGQLSFDRYSLWGMLIYGLVAGVLLVLAEKLVRTSQREKELNRKLQLVRGELQHRIKNFITVVQALAVQAGRSSSDTADFDAKFMKRLQALAGAQGLIDDPRHSSAGLALLIERTLAPFNEAGRLEVNCMPDVRVTEDVAVGIALILNELATNALKYGSLCAPAGKVALTVEKHGDRACMVWLEEGGAMVSPPSRTGFGTRLIRSALPKGRGKAEIEYRPTGVQCRMDFAYLAD